VAGCSARVRNGGAKADIYQSEVRSRVAEQQLRAKAFYDPLMSLIGFRLLKLSEKAAHYGASDIVFSVQRPVDGQSATPGNGAHVAFQASDRETIRRFCETAISNGERDEGALGIRENYNAN
jgi:hypothetical protein